MSFASFKKILVENQIMVVLFALIIGYLFPQTFKSINRYSTELLMFVFFTSSLRISPTEIFNYAKDIKLLLLIDTLKLIVLPLALFLPASWLIPDWALAFLIMGAMPTGMTIALVADFFKGKTSLALVITAITSLAAPLTIPCIFSVAIGKNIDIPALNMFWSLCITIVIPFILAAIFKKIIPHFVNRHENSFRELSVIAFAILIIGITADTSQHTAIIVTWRDILIMSGTTLWLGFLVWVSAALASWRTPNERVTIALCMVYLNNTLALFVADKFFRSQHVVPQMLMLLLVINLLLPPLRIIAKRLITHPHPTQFI